MSEFLAPLDYRRAKDTMRALDFYTAYTPDGAARVAALLKERYPMVFARTEPKTLANGALVLEMPGANITDPLVFVSHMDSLHCKEPPITSLAPFSAPLQRAHVIALLEALDALLQSGYQPGGELFIALSMDGLGTGAGAKSVVEYLQKRQISPCFVLDHGGYATHAAFRRYLPKGAPLALIGITEKGRLEGRLIATGTQAGDDRSAARPLNVLLKCGSRLGMRPRRASLCKASEQMLREIARHAPLFPSLLIARPRVTFPLLKAMWRKRAIMAQFFESELTVTGVSTQGEPSRSPTEAELTFSLQTVPGKKLPAWKNSLRRKVCRHGARMEITVENEHSSRSRTDGEAWVALETAIEILFERAVIAPCLSPNVTDGRFYSALNGKVYRFSPFLLSGEEALRGECTVDDCALQTAVQFFRQMLSV
ncbi:MAG TPA: M20/M25/M40 family metallo-hydrolase [Candidatus Limiplasma sp.]|nr:M20/M25/M40 family metallo-hydrolase [Candidatus Limiplasma sp.]